ncbi:MAG: NUDIX hydrolase [Desulfatiglandales bacterium]
MDIHGTVEILANWWQLVGWGGLISLVVFMQKRYKFFSSGLAKVTGVKHRAEVFETVWRAGLRELEALEIADAKLYSIRTSGMPRLERNEVSDLLPEELPWMKRPDLLQKSREVYPTINKSHGFAVGQDFRQPGDTSVRFVRSDFRMVLSARSAGIKPPIISANAIIFCPMTRRVLVHLRAATVATYANALHFIGGNYEPSVGTERYDDSDFESPLRQAAIREIKEETGIKVSNLDKCLVVVGEETASGFVQFTYTGISVSSVTETLDPSAEGGVIWCALSALVRFAETGSLSGRDSDSIKIVPSFALTLLIWLKLGAPDEHKRTPMRKEALEAYAKILPHIKKRLAPYKVISE